MHGPSGLREELLRALADPLDLLYPAQREMVEEAIRPGARVADHSGRGSGKTEGLAHGCQKILREDQTAPIAWIGLTRQSAIDNVWPVMRRVNESLGNYLSPLETKARWMAPGGGMFAVFGANKADELEKLRGKKWRLVVIDESASFKRSLLKYLAEEVIEPRLVDLNGGLAVIGSPGAARTGYYFNICQGNDGYRVFCRNMLENPFIPDAAAWLERHKQRKGGDDDNPTLLREYFGQWVRDEGSLVYKLSTARNVIQFMPDDYRPGSPDWMHVLSHDYGVVDSTSWTVWAWRRNRHENRLYAVESFKWRGDVPAEYIDLLEINHGDELLGPDSARISKHLADRDKPIALVGDPGGGGKDFIGIARRQYGLNIRPAYKVGKEAQIEMFNTGLRTGQIQLVDGRCRDLIEEMEIQQWKTSLVEVEVQGVIRHEERKEVDKRFEDHCCDGARYGLTEARRYMNDTTTRPPEVFESDDQRVTETIRRQMLKKIEKRRKKQWWDR